MITMNNNKSQLVIPKFSFVACLSSPFLNRQQQVSYVVNTALIGEQFSVELEFLFKYLNVFLQDSKGKNIDIYVCIIMPQEENLPNKNNESMRYNNMIYIFMDIDKLSTFLLGEMD